MLLSELYPNFVIFYPTEFNVAMIYLQKQGLIKAKNIIIVFDEVKAEKVVVDGHDTSNSSDSEDSDSPSSSPPEKIILPPPRSHSPDIAAVPQEEPSSYLKNGCRTEIIGLFGRYKIFLNSDVTQKQYLTNLEPLTDAVIDLERDILKGTDFETVFGRYMAHMAFLNSENVIPSMRQVLLEHVSAIGAELSKFRAKETEQKATSYESTTRKLSQ